MKSCLLGLSIIVLGAMPLKRQMIALDLKKKEARIVYMVRIQEGVQKSLAGEPRAQLMPMGETRTILDHIGFYSAAAQNGLFFGNPGRP